MAAAAGVVQNFQIHKRFATTVGGGHSVVDTGFDQALRQGGRRVIAGRGFARVASAFEVHLTFFYVHFAPCAKAFFFANVGLVIGIKVGLYGFAFGDAAFIFQVHGAFQGALKAKLQQAFINAAQVGHTHVFEVALGIKQRGASACFVQQFFK